MLNFLKEHPVLSAGGIFVLGVVLVVIFFSGDDAAANTGSSTIVDNTSAVEANTQLSMMQIQGQTDMAGINAQLSAAIASNSTALEIAKLENARGSKADDLSATIAASQISAQSATQQLMSTLSAAVQNNQIEAQRDMYEMNATTQVQLYSIQAASQKEMQATYAGMIAGITKAQNDRELGLAEINYKGDALAITAQQATATAAAQAAAGASVANNAANLAASAKEKSRQRSAITSQINALTSQARAMDKKVIEVSAVFGPMVAQQYKDQASGMRSQIKTLQRQLAAIK